MTLDVRITSNAYDPVFEVHLFPRYHKTYQISRDLFDRYIKSIKEFNEVQEELRKIVDKDD